jgi:predicted ATP-dependent serine protease
MKMKTLTRSVGKKDIGGEPIPSVFKAFSDNNIVIRRSEVSMIAGAPGAGKSTIALAEALRTQVPTLYICADTNQHTMAMRLLSMITGVSQREAEFTLATEPLKAKDVLRHAAHIFWSFDSVPTLDDINEEVTAFEELWGESPTMIIVDNLMDVALDSGEEFAAMRSVMKELKYLARDTNAAVVVLHHTSEAHNGDPCPPLRSVQGKVNQLPALILTVGQTPQGVMGVAAVKNRYGRADQSGKTPVWLQFNGEYMFIADLEIR